MSLTNKKDRKLCPTCNFSRPVGVNRIIGDKIYYRKQCDHCLRNKKKLKPMAPSWFKSGYRKKEKCEKCGFKAKYPEDQLRVFYLDGNLRNNNWSNLKTLCLNCQQEVHKMKLPWKPADLVPDF